ncbi:MAG: undecaprenyldiphospho-muramoylpentapeptide beta-N-acetylglucosaminyltransferase [Ruminococcaceae bacterium]|nr:undecaprenyldiphospho-muramoylpentapeptide beta-N-acetylglucosaminyltransferase [Oscillospiraceae bacterium]
MLNNKKIIFTTGGTGGHINPALAVAGEIRRKYPDAKILFVGTSDRLETKLVPDAGFELRTIEMSGFQRKPSLENLKRNLLTVKRLLTVTGKVKKIFSDFNPDIVIGFGGYVSGPVVRTAAKSGIPTVIHEQNAFPGVTNKALAKMVDKVMLTAAEAEKYMQPKNPVEVTGLPVRHEIVEADRSFARAELGVGDKPLILSMGGSLGARTINDAMVEVIKKLQPEHKFRFIHATGKFGTWVPDKLKENGVDLDDEDLDIREYINNMDVCMAAADIIIGRSGASTLSELQATGSASILIPSPNVTENHQYHNAMELVKCGAAEIIEEKDLTGEILTNKILEIFADENKLESMRKNAKEMAILDSTDRIIKIIEDTIR